MTLLEQARQLQKRGKLADAARIYSKILETDPEHVECIHYLGLIKFKQKRFEKAFALLEQALRLAPNNDLFRSNCELAHKQYAELTLIVDHMRKEVAEHPKDYIRINTLVAALLDMGLRSEALEMGQKSLTLQNQQCATDIVKSVGVLPRKKPAFSKSEPDRNIIAFSLWGEDDYYITGALENARLANEIYPGWRCRFYVDSTIRPDVRGKLASYGAQVLVMPNNNNGKFGLFWRYFAAGDPNVDYFICRDCDCRLNLKEQAAVNEWINLGGLFHVMRDNIRHTMLMPAGMWGGIGGVFGDMEQLARQYYQENFVQGSKRSEWIDQEFLATVVWPVIAGRTLTHDSYYKIRSTRGFPSDGGLRPPAHVGGAVPRASESRFTQRRPYRSDVS